jgi:lysophospholipase L1-like esterase
MQTPLFAPAEVLTHQTVRLIAHISRGGDSLRVTLSNSAGTRPLKISAASLGVRADGATIRAGTLRPLLFGGETSIIVAAGASALSDAVALHVENQADLAISLFVLDATAANTQLSTSHQTSFVSGPGDFTGSLTLSPARTIASWYWLSAIDVRMTRGRALIAFGDSITEGCGVTTDGNTRWPDALARRLLAAADELGAIGVVNVGIGGNRVLEDGVGPNAQSRLDRDLITRSGAVVVIFLEGINDIGMVPWNDSKKAQSSAVNVQSIVAGYKQIIARAHAAGITIYGGTLTAVGGSGYASVRGEAIRQGVNAWIRSAHGFDAVIDFDAATRDPAHQDQLLPAYDSGDHLHPNDRGYAAMAAAVDLQLLRPQR